MKISACEKFEYVGYTEGVVGKPTSFFKGGRYTRSHSDLLNEGWHPLKYKYHRGADISKNDHAYYSSLRNDPCKAKGMAELNKKFKNGEFDCNDETL